jgi:hypothetical protein
VVALAIVIRWRRGNRTLQWVTENTDLNPADVTGSSRAPFSPSLAWKADGETKKESHHPEAKEVPAVILGADGNVYEHHEQDEEGGSEHPMTMRPNRWKGARFRTLAVWPPTEEFKGTASVLAVIGAGLAVAMISASFSERARTASSIVLGCVGSLLVVDYFRDKLVSQIRYIVLGTAAFIVGWIAYSPLNGIHLEVVHVLVASICGGSVVIGYECVKRLRQRVKTTGRKVSNDVLISIGCALIAVAAVIAISPL